MEGKKVEEYLEILYPGSKDNQEIYYFEKEYDKSFIQNNIDEINKYFNRFAKNKEIYGEEWQHLTDIELMKKAIDEAKTRYCYNTLNSGKEFEGEHLTYNNLADDIDFIYTHLYEIETEYLELLKEKQEKYKSWSDDELLELALKTTKGNIYFDLLYPEYEETEKTSEYQLTTSKDLEFIFDNLEEIDKEYRKIIHEKTINDEEIDKLTMMETIKTVINLVKARVLNENEKQVEHEETTIEEKGIEQNNEIGEGIEELLNNLNIEENEKKAEVDEEAGAREYNIEIPTTKQVVSEKDIANADMNIELAENEVNRKQNFFERILGKNKNMVQSR